LIERTPSPGGVSYELCSLHKNQRKRTPPEEPPQKWNNSGIGIGWFFRGVFVLPVLDLRT